MESKETKVALNLSPAARAHRLGDLMLEKKARDLVVIEIDKISSLADYIVIATVDNSRQLKAVAQDLDEAMKEEGAPRLGIEGRDQAWWVLLDFGDVIVHLMQAEAREFYDLEQLWADGEIVRRSDDDGTV
ncbi:MAG: ribosome silencing factor [Planctomycetota bacterium]